MSPKNPTERFTGLAKIYAQARPNYPSQAIEAIIATGKLDSKSILVDVGCGTGISSRLFAERGINVIGIEPNSNMRAQAEAENDKTKSIKYINATAENTSLPDNSADVVLCAQSFHWFDAEKAFLEFKRILKPDGWLALMWNERDEKDTFTAAYGNLLRTLPETKSVEGPREYGGLALMESHLFDKQKKITFSNEQILNEEGLLARAFSASYVPKQGEDAERVKSELKNLFAQNDHNGSVILRYETSIYLGHCNK